MIPLNGIGFPFYTKYKLIQFKGIRDDVVRNGDIDFPGGAQVKTRVHPSINFNPATVISHMQGLL
jgi:hypothetical protein